MNIVIIGGNSGTGALLARLAAEQGHRVTVVSRSGFATADSRIRQLKGDAGDPEFVASTLDGADAVVITVGGSKGVKQARARVTTAVVRSMQQAGVGRLLVQSSLGAGDSMSQLPGAIGFVTKLLLAGPLADHSAQEAVVKASGLNWNIVRPTGLNNKPATGRWQALEIGETGNLRGSVSRHDLAAFMLEVLTDHDTVHRAFGVSSV